MSYKNNLKFWKTLVGLPSHFPDIYELSDDEILDIMVIDPEQKSIINRSVDANLYTQVVFNKGGGVTTLFKYLFQESVISSVEKLIIPIKIDLEDSFSDDEITFQWVEDAIKRQVISILIEKGWESRLNSVHYYHCINYEEGGVDLYVYKTKMLRFLVEKKPSYKQICEKFPFLKEPLQDVLNYMLKNFRIQTVLFYHFPQKIEEQRILDLTSSLKILYEQNRFDDAAIREIYFCTPNIQRDIDREFKRPFSAIKYPHYTPAQIYTMLVKRYNANVPGTRGRNMVSLSSVFSEEFIRKVWSPRKALKEIIENVKNEINIRLTCPESQVPFRLEPKGKPKPQQTKPEPSEIFEPETDAQLISEEQEIQEKPKKRFIRKKRS